jgi:hypothetical protein
MNWDWFYRMGSPKWFYYTTSRWLPWLGVMTLCLLVTGLVWGLAFAPEDAKQGNSFRIIYLHVPASLLALAGYFLMAAAGAIGLITLIGAAIGLMNIMLVAVNERTREVGLIKALGGKKRDVRRQFLFESILISILGAIFGIILGVLVGNIFSIVLKTGFIVPWLWVGIGIAICTLVGLVAGIYPAMKAAALNPIDALRYE